MDDNVLYDGESITDHTPEEVGVAWQGGLSLRQEQALMYTDLYRNL